MKNKYTASPLGSVFFTILMAVLSHGIITISGDYWWISGLIILLTYTGLITTRGFLSPRRHGRTLLTQILATVAAFGFLGATMYSAANDLPFLSQIIAAACLWGIAYLLIRSTIPKSRSWFRGLALLALLGAIGSYLLGVSYLKTGFVVFLEAFLIGTALLLLVVPSLQLKARSFIVPFVPLFLWCILAIWQRIDAEQWMLVVAHALYAIGAIVMLIAVLRVDKYSRLDWSHFTALLIFFLAFTWYSLSLFLSSQWLSSVAFGLISIATLMLSYRVLWPVRYLGTKAACIAALGIFALGIDTYPDDKLFGIIICISALAVIVFTAELHRKAIRTAIPRYKEVLLEKR